MKIIKNYLIIFSIASVGCLHTINVRQYEADLDLQAHLQGLSQKIEQTSVKQPVMRPRASHPLWREIKSGPLVQEGNIEEKPIVIITTSYNNKDWYQWNLDSIFKQKYSNFRVIYINDVSSDGTGELVADYIKAHGLEDRIQLIHNTHRLLATANHDAAIHSCKDEEIILIVNGDDWLAHDRVLSYINHLYSESDIWLTYGQYQVYPGGQIGHCCEMPVETVVQNAFRQFTHTPSHLRTFYAGLYKNIKDEDLRYEGEYLKMTEDMAMMMPMIEMAREGHFKFVSDVLLTYNSANIINDHKVSQSLQKNMDLFIRGKQPYDTVAKPFKSYIH